MRFLVSGLLAGCSALALALPAPRAAPADLLATYVPVFELYRADWKPSAVEPFLAAADLERFVAGRWRLVRRSPAASSLPPGSKQYRLDTRGCSPAVNVDSCYRRRPSPPTVYGRVWSSAGPNAAVTVLQYWVFYPLDDWRNSPTRPRLWHMHEGDWEEVSVELGPAGRPVAVACSQHDLGVTRTWAHVRLSGGTHPVVYVALGSHANYLSPGFHGLAGVPHEIPPRFSGVPLPEPDFTSTQVAVRPAVVELSAAATPWISFAGAWGDGSFVLLEQATRTGFSWARLRVGDSPTGPAFHSIWRDPQLQFQAWPADDGH